MIVGGCATYTAALHLMRTGAGRRSSSASAAAPRRPRRRTLGISVPLASAVADVAAARRDYMDESGGRYVHVIADGGLGRSGDLVKAIACGADGLMVGAALARAEEAPGRGHHWGSEAHHPTLTRGHRVPVGTVATARADPVRPPRSRADGTTNLVGALASRHGHHRLPRPQGVPAGSRSVTTRLTRNADRRAQHRGPGGRCAQERISATAPEIVITSARDAEHHRQHHPHAGRRSAFPDIPISRDDDLLHALARHGDLLVTGREDVVEVVVLGVPAHGRS